MTTSVTDAFSNRPEHIQETAKVLGKSLPRRAIYQEVYRGHKRVKTVSEIALRTNLDRKVVLNRGRELERGGIIRSDQRDGEQAYAQIPDQLHIRDRVLALAGDSAAIAAIETKRASSRQAQVFTIVQNNKPRERKVSKDGQDAKWRIALMLASPIGHDALNVSMEAREIEIERRKALFSNLFSVKTFPAADIDSWTMALNDYRPHIIHFSGHAGGSSILVDNSHVDQLGGTKVHFRTLAKILGTAPLRPRLLVMNACKTLEGSEPLVSVVDAVIAMSDSIADSSAYHYSRRLYAALFSGLTIDKAHSQAKATLEVDNLEDALLPIILHHPDYDVESSAFD